MLALTWVHLHRAFPWRERLAYDLPIDYIRDLWWWCIPLVLDLVKDTKIRVLPQHCLGALLEMKVVQNYEKFQDKDLPPCQALICGQFRWTCYRS